MSGKHTYLRDGDEPENRDFPWRRCWWVAGGADFPPYVVQYRRPFRGGGLYIVKGNVDSPPLAGPFDSLRLAFVALELLS